MGICTVCFAFTSIISWAYYGTSCAGYLFGARYTRAYTGVYVLCILLGAILSLPLVWELSGVLCALMIIPNLIALWLLRRDIHPYSIAADR